MSALTVAVALVAAFHTQFVLEMFSATGSPRPVERRRENDIALIVRRIVRERREIVVDFPDLEAEGAGPPPT